ncbi:MAG: PrsW family intramembrane metalloprotease [Myxococcota bacterium]
MLAQWQLGALGALPALAAMAVFDRLDAKRPEPRATLRRVALAGALSAIPVVAVGRLLAWASPLSAEAGAGVLGAAYLAFVVVAIPEEAAKLLSMVLFAWRRPEFDERMDGIVYGARAGLGFALVENVTYLALMPSGLRETVTLFLGRAILAVPGHAIWGGIMGYYAARRRFDGVGPGMLGGLALAVVMHGTYDLLLFCAPIAVAAGYSWVGLGVAGVPLVAYAVPAAIIGGGAFALRGMARAAIAADDRALGDRGP